MTKQLNVDNEKVLMDKMTIYTFLQKFYAGELNKVNREIWNELQEILKEATAYISNEEVCKGLHELSKATEEDYSQLEFDFNRLFVGPNRLEVSPYESNFRHSERAIMQRDTMAVRNFYERAGLVVSKKNVDADDHMALELEFVCYLLANSLENNHYLDLYEEFLHKHLFQWIPPHALLIRKKTNNSVIRGVSYILQALILDEKSNISI